MSKLNKTVLLVEDNEDNQIVYSTVLRHYGFEVLEAINGRDALKRAQEESPDLILMDVSIPIIDGLEVTKILKADSRTNPIPIIALTAHALSEDRDRAFEAGCDGYLAKPCDPKTVVQEVEKYLGPAKGAGVGGGTGGGPCLGGRI